MAGQRRRRARQILSRHDSRHEVDRVRQLQSRRPRTGRSRSAVDPGL